MAEIQGVLNQTHAYIPLYKQASQVMSEKPEDQHDGVVIQLCAERTQDLRCYNLPTANDEVAANIPGDGSEVRSNHRDIVLRLKGVVLKGLVICTQHMLHFTMFCSFHMVKMAGI